MAETFERGEWSFRGRRVTGVVRRRLVARTEVGGQVVAASRQDPRYLVRSERTGNETARRPGALKKLSE